MYNSSNELQGNSDCYRSGASMLSESHQAGTYAAHQPPAPPLGYIVAYTPEQLTEIIRDQYRSGHQSSQFHYPTQTAGAQTKSVLIVSIYN